MMKIWASAKSIREEIADVPHNWLIQFASMYPDRIRKLGDARNSTLLFNVDSVLECINAGAIHRPALSSVKEVS